MADVGAIKSSPRETRIPLARVKFTQTIGRPVGKSGVCPGGYEEFWANPSENKKIRPGEDIQGYNLWLDGDWIIIEDRVSGGLEWVAKSVVLQVRPA
jgi:hypothetical protein